MKSKITDKFQITIPKKIREKLKIARSDALEWKFRKGFVVVEPVKNSFLNYKNAILTGKGDIGDDIRTARRNIAKKSR